MPYWLFLGIFLTDANARARQMLDATRQNGAGTQERLRDTRRGGCDGEHPQILYLVWWVQIFFNMFIPKLGEDSHFDSYFFRWVETTN